MNTPGSSGSTRPESSLDREIRRQARKALEKLERKQLRAARKATEEAPPVVVVPEGEKRFGLEELRSKYREDFEGFCRHVEVFTENAEGEGGTVRKIVPFLSTQSAFNKARTRRDIILKARQQGFTTLEVARDVWFFLTRPGSRTVIVVQSKDDDGPVNNASRMVKGAFEGLAKDRFDLRDQFTKYTGRLFQLKNGAVLEIIVAGASERAAVKVAAGYSIHRLHVTEVAKFEAADLTMLSLTSCVTEGSGTEVVIESTANGAQGYFYEKWQSTLRGEGSYKGHFFPWWARDDRRLPVPTGKFQPRSDRERDWAAKGVSPEQVEWYRRKQADVKRQDLVDQDFPSDDATCFILSGSGFFDPKALAALKLQCKEPIQVQEVRSNGSRGQLRYYAAPDPRKRYVLAADPSGGQGGDPCAAHVYERGTGRHMASLDGQIPPWEFGRWLAELGKRYNTAEIAVERNNHGGTTLAALQQECKYPRIFLDMDGKPGWNNTEVARTPALDKLEEVVRTGQYKCRDAIALADFFHFVTSKRGKPEAAPGRHDDHVLAAAIGFDALTRREQSYDLSNLPAF